MSVASQENAVFTLERADGTGEFLFVCEHASNRIPERYNDLGLNSATLASHAAWDPGALELARALSSHFDSPLFSSTVSRLVYDCNRPPESDTAIVSRSERFTISANAQLSESEKHERADSVYRPFHDHLAQLIEQRVQQGRTLMLVTVHSFTPMFNGEKRTVELGVLHDKDARLADAMLQHAASKFPLLTRRNEPYDAGDGVTHTLQLHALGRGILNVMLEIRNDLLTSDESVQLVAGQLAALLSNAADTLRNDTDSAQQAESPSCR